MNETETKFLFLFFFPISHLGLGKLIVLYDDNLIQIDGTVS